MPNLFLHVSVTQYRIVTKSHTHTQLLFWTHLRQFDSLLSFFPNCLSVFSCRFIRNLYLHRIVCVLRMNWTCSNSCFLLKCLSFFDVIYEWKIWTNTEKQTLFQCLLREFRLWNCNSGCFTEREKYIPRTQQYGKI